MAKSSSQDSNKRKLEGSPNPTSSSSSLAPSTKRKKPRFGSTAFVTVEVGEGEDSHIFTVYEDFLCYYSPYFRALFEGPFQEGKTKKSTLREHSPYVFELFLTWIYTQKLEVSEEEPPDRGSLIRLWVLADMLLIPDLQNLAIEGINKQTEMSNTICNNMFQYVYENTMVGSPLRKLMVFQAAWQVSTKHIIKFKNVGVPYLEWPEEMLRDVVFELMKHNYLTKHEDPKINIKDFYTINNNVGE